MCKIKWNDGKVVLKNIIEENGNLCPIEGFELPFEPKRFFIVTNVPKLEVRGEHSHYEGEQVLICLQGEIFVSLYDGINNSAYYLKPFEGIYVKKMVWDAQQYMTGKDVLLSVCSTNYDKKDYIEDVDEFRKLKGIL